MSAGVGPAHAHLAEPRRLDAAETATELETGAVASFSRRDAVVVHGPDARAWLQGQVSQELTGLEVAGSVETLVLSPQGRIECFCRLSVLADDVVLLDTDEGFGPALADRLRRFRLRVKAELEPGQVGVLELRGPRAIEQLAGHGPGPRELDGADRAPSLEGPWLLGAAVDWRGLSGVDVIGPKVTERWPVTGVPIGWPEELEAARIRAGVPRMGRELTEKTIPQEAGDLVARTVSFDKGCYTGQELVARIDARGSNVARRLRLITVIEGPRVEPGDSLVVEEREVGQLTSAAESSNGPVQVGLAYIRRGIEPGTEALAGPNGSRALIGELPGGRD